VLLELLDELLLSLELEVLDDSGLLLELLELLDELLLSLELEVLDDSCELLLLELLNELSLE